MIQPDVAGQVRYLVPWRDEPVDRQTMMADVLALNLAGVSLCYLAMVTVYAADI